MDVFSFFVNFQFFSEESSHILGLCWVSPVPPSQYGVESALKQTCLSPRFRQVTYTSLGRPPQVTLNRFDLLSGQASFLGRSLIWPCHFGARSFGHFWNISFEFGNICWIRFSSWESFIDLHIWGCLFSTSLACLLTVVPPTLCIIL